MRNVIEIIRNRIPGTQPKVVIFDFDGTLSLIRSGWMDVMVPLCVDELRRASGDEATEQLTDVVEEFVWRLTGKETIYQMMALADAVRERGGSPAEPLAYKRMYLDRLHARIHHRLDALRTGTASPDAYLVPGARPMLDLLKSLGVRLFLASGTDHANVKEEASLLGVADYFEDRIFGAKDDLSSFSKALLVQKIVSEAGFNGNDLLVFGDGYVEIEEVKKVGGVAVGVASAEPECRQVDKWKRERLIRAGADYVIPNFLEARPLASTLFDATILEPVGEQLQ